MKPVWLLLITVASWAEEPDGVAPRHFDVASVKEVHTENVRPSRITTNPGRLKAESVSIGGLIAYAYDVQPVQIAGLKSELARYDVEGKADGAASRSELRLMLQTLLTDRFRLRFHREVREMPMERLVIGKNPQLKAAKLVEADPRGFTLGASDRGPRFLKAMATAMSLEWLADNLSDHRSTLVMNGTGLKGVYEFEVNFEFDRTDAADTGVPVRDASNHMREELLSALGLRLQSVKKAQVQVLLIDQVKRPGPN
ncbi:MAG: TIGR03435 family protein [Candidatus Solibacter sp.]